MKTSIQKKSILYARVSTDEQAEKGHSIPHQLEECRRYANRLGFQVVKEIVDNKSGASLDRPGFALLESMLSNGEADAIIAYTSDRISRNYYEYVPLVGKWQDQNIELHFVDRGQSHNNLQGMISDGIFAMLAHTERLKILDRTMNGRIKKARDDKKPVMSGNVPFGYGRVGRFQDAEMYIDETEAEIVKKIFRWYITDDDGGPFSLMAIAKHLDELGVRPKNAKQWNATSVRVILTNEIYVGRTYYRKTQILKDGRQVPRPKEEWIPIDVHHLAFIDKELFEQAAIRAKHNQETSRRNRKHDYLLVGHIRCGSCDLAMYGFRKWEGSTPYYRCASYNHKAVQCAHNNRRSIKMSVADTAVWEWLSNFLSDEDSLLNGIQEMIDQREGVLRPKRERQAYILKTLDAIDDKIRRLIDELAEFSGETVKIAVKEKTKQLEAERNLLEEENIRLASELAQVELAPDIESRVPEIIMRVRDKLSNPTFKNKRDLMELFNVSVTFYNRGKNIKLGVTIWIPEGDEIIVYNAS